MCRRTERKSLKRNKREKGYPNLLQLKDQEMSHDSLPLKNCIYSEIPIRAIGGHDSMNNYMGKLYICGGLYQVVKYCAGRGLSSFYV